MSEDPCSDEEWCAFTNGQFDDGRTEAKCWECGKQFREIKSLMLHYKSHDIQATCHICKITFRRLTSLSMHLDNVHLPPLCKKCNQYFSNTWELNKHTERHCMASFQEASSFISADIYQNQNYDNFPDAVTSQYSTKLLSELRLRQRIEMKPVKAEASVNSVEYVVGEDDNIIDKESYYSSTSEQKMHPKPADLCPDDPESDGGSSSSDSSSDSSHSPQPPPPSFNSTMCDACGKGPFRSMKLHLRHCSGVRAKYQCSVCKKGFQSEAPLKKHYMPLYSCEFCGQVFTHTNTHHHHQCPKGTRSALVLFCTESMPPACKICKSFFTSEKTLLNHVTMVHTSVVSTKVCIITNPSALTDGKVSPGVHGTAVLSAISHSNEANQVMNGKLHVGQTYAGSLSKSSPSSAILSMAPSAAPVRLGKDGALDQTNQPSRRLSAPIFVPQVATDTSPANAASDSVTPPMPTIMALFENDSQEAALMKRMNTGWRSKTPYPCRQCGAILRQPSFIISHRYLHRGRRLHQCQCGRAFKHQLHLLRHCVQHAEAVSYICVSCGESFTGAKLLTEHMKGKSQKKSHSGRTQKFKVKKKCRMSFTCDCGQLFFRPSAYIWHQLRNKRTKKNQWKKPLE